MTIEELEEYRRNGRFILSEIDALNLQIEHKYDTRKSPAGGDGTHGSTPGDPTGRTAQDIIEMKEELAALQNRWADIVRTIDQWLLTVDDPEIRSIVRWHYSLGYSWKRTSGKVYGRNDYYLARKRIHRFFGKE